MNNCRIYVGDVIEKLREIEDESIQCVVTSPPYWGLRDYETATWEGGDAVCDHKQRTSRRDGGRQKVDKFNGSSSPRSDKNTINYRDTCGKCGAKRIDNQIGLEETPEEYIAKLVEVFEEVRRVLRKDGILWLNLGDSYATSPTGSFNGGGFKDNSALKGTRDMSGVVTSGVMNKLKASGLKPKDLCMIPARVAIALQQAGWWLRSEIVWCKVNPMPESVTDRPTKSHEMIYLLTKSARYYYDAEAIMEKSVWAEKDKRADGNGKHKSGGKSKEGYYAIDGVSYGKKRGFAKKDGDESVGEPQHHGQKIKMGFFRNKRDVWTINTENFDGAHFATFPTEIPRICIAAGSKEGDVILDPFCGSGTTGEVAMRMKRKFIGIELNEKYVKEIIEPRLNNVNPLFNQNVEVI